MNNAERIFFIAERQANSIAVCVDRLQQLGAVEELLRISGHLQVLAARALPLDKTYQ